MLTASEMNTKRGGHSKSSSTGELLSQSSVFRGSVVSRKSDYLIDIVDDNLDIKINVGEKGKPEISVIEEVNSSKITDRSIELIRGESRPLSTLKLPLLNDSMDANDKLADLILRDLKSRYSDLRTFSKTFVSLNKSVSSNMSNNDPKFSHIERFVSCI
jgi:hypothetical protein